MDLFSTFLQFEDDRVSRWVTDSQLRRSMNGVLAQMPDAPSTESFWATYWSKGWHAQTALAASHLAAYLQETCYWVAQKAVSRAPSSQFKLPDYFQIAIAALPKILRGFDPDGIATLKTFATTAFSNVIRDALRQRREIDVSSDWGVLLKISRKRLREALQHAGFSTEAIDRYLLAWVCFEAVYIQMKPAKMRQLQRPDPATWDEIARLYNCDRPDQRSAPEADCTPAVLEKWLLDCVKHARTYLYPAVASLNAPQAGQETGELQDQVPDDRADSLLAPLITEEELAERQAQQSQVSAVLTNALAQLDEQANTMMQFYYRERLTQQQIAAQLGIPQYTVSRRLSKIREALLLALAKWGQETLHISTTSNVLKHMSTVLEEWLEGYYRPAPHDSAKESL